MNATSRLWRAMGTERRGLLLAAIAGALASLCAVALLGTSAWLIARAAEAPPVLTLTVAAVMVRAFALGRAGFRYGERLLGHDAALRGLTQLRVGVYRGLERISPVGLSGWSRGDLLSRLVGDVDTAIDLPLRVALPWIQAVLVSAATVGFVLWVMPSAGAVLGVLALGALLLVPWAVSTLSARADRMMAPAKADLGAAMLISLRGMADLETNEAEPAALASIGVRDQALTRVNRRVAWALAASGGASAAAQGAAVTLMLALAVPAVTDGRLAPVWLAVVALLPLALFDILGSLPTSASALRRVHVAAARIDEIVQAEPLTSGGEQRVDARNADIHIVNMSAAWPGHERPDVRVDELHVPAGRTLAIVGPSGSGKSTLAAVLRGVLPYTGSIRVGDAEVRNATSDSLHSEIGYLSQREHVFDATLAANLRIAAPDADAERLLQAALRAGLGPLLSTMPKGLDQEVGSFGTALSGGERQRLALARLLLGRHHAVILDEPTEHLDPATASDVEDVLRAELAGRSVVMITHRMQTAASAHRIAVLVEGVLEDLGSHGDLLARGGWYALRWQQEMEQRELSGLIGQLPVGVGVAWPSTRQD